MILRTVARARPWAADHELAGRVDEHECRSWSCRLTYRSFGSWVERVLGISAGLTLAWPLDRAYGGLSSRPAPSSAQRASDGRGVRAGGQMKPAPYPAAICRRRGLQRTPATGASPMGLSVRSAAASTRASRSARTRTSSLVAGADSVSGWWRRASGAGVVDALRDVGRLLISSATTTPAYLFVEAVLGPRVADPLTVWRRGGECGCRCCVVVFTGHDDQARGDGGERRRDASRGVRQRCIEDRSARYGRRSSGMAWVTRGGGGGRRMRGLPDLQDRVTATTTRLVRGPC